MTGNIKFTSPPARSIFDYVSYDAKTGHFTRIFSPYGKKIGTRADRLHSKGYRWVKVCGGRHYAHRLAWYFTYNEWPVLDIDHIDGDRTNNKISNLRLATRSQNMMNARVKGRCLKGVTFEKASGRFVARIRRDGVLVQLGRFDSEERAHVAYLAAAKVLFGEFARAA